MAFPVRTCIFMLLANVLISVNCQTADTDTNVSRVPEMTHPGHTLPPAFYLDMRERLDHLDQKICDSEKQLSEINLKIDYKIENLALKLQLELRDQHASLVKELKALLDVATMQTKNFQPRSGSPVLEPYSTGMSDKMDNVSSKIDNVGGVMAQLQSATSRLDDTLYTLSQKADVCVRTVVNSRHDNSSESDDLQGAAASAWITVLRRMDGRVNFTRSWDDYKKGFGDLGAEFWLGLEDIHQLTAVRSYRLRVMLTDFSGEVKFAEYSNFYVRGEADNYRLHVSGYVTGSTAGDSFGGHNNMQFSTYDKDNDRHKNSCAQTYKGGWWYGACHSVNPTGLYLSEGSTSTRGINWEGAYKDRRSFKRLEMSIRHH